MRLLPGRCAPAYVSTRSGDAYYEVDAEPAYIAFSFADASGQWGAGRFQQVPDIGFVDYSVAEAAIKRAGGHAVLAGAARKMCVRRGPTSYSITGDLEVDCATFRVTDADRGQWTALLSAFYFRPQYGFWPRNSLSETARHGLITDLP